MKKRIQEKGLIIILIFTCTLMGQISSVHSEQFTPLLKVSAVDIYLTAGEENEIEITLQNMGDFDVYEVKSILSVSATTTPGISILDGAHKIFNKIADGRSKTYYPILYVNRDVPLGTYTLTLELEYRKIYKQGIAVYESTMVQIGIVVENVTKTQVWLDTWMEELKLETGTEDKAKIGIENIGEEPVYNIDAKVASTSPYVVVIEGARFTKDLLETGENATFTPTLAVSKSAPLGVYTLTASLSYSESDGREHMETFTLGFSIYSVKISKQTSIILKGYETNLETIKPGDRFHLNFELECLGATAYDVKTLLSLDSSTGIATMSPTLISVGDVEPNQSEEITYELLIGGEVKAGQYPARLTISYLDVEGVPRTSDETVTLSIRGIIEFRLINLDPIKAVGGIATEFEADLLLIGTESIKFVQIDVVEDEIFMRTSGSTEYIGAIDSDSPIPFNLMFEVTDEVEAEDYTMTLRVTYTDDLNKEYEKKVEVPITVEKGPADTKPSQGLFQGFWLWLRRLLGLIP